MAEAPEPRTVTFPARAWAAMAITMTLMLGTLFVQLVAVNHQREIAKRQEERTVRVLEATRDPLRDVRPAADDAAALVERLRALAPEATRLARDGSALARASMPLVEELRATELGRTAQALTALAETLLDENRLAVATDRTARFLADAERRGLLDTLDALRLLPELVEVQRRTLAIQERTLAVQRRSYGILRQSLRIQQQTLVHARNLDEKTGGQLPVVPPAGSR